MANKSRPKKIKAPYKKYVAGQGYKQLYLGGINHPKMPARTDMEIVETPQGLYYYSESTDDIVHIPNVSLPVKNDVSSKMDVAHETMKLPFEIQALIIQFSYVEDTLPLEFLSVCKTWYSICVPFFYRSPRLSTKNFNLFVNAIIENKKKKLGDYVVLLDLSTILQSGKNSYVSKLLRRCCMNLEKFIAPQTSFGYAPLISLKSCHNLKYLDLGLVSETVKLKELFSAIQNFKQLTHLSFPRSSINCENCKEFQWPSNLQYLKLSGGITNEFVHETRWPRTITTLEFSYCPQIDEHSVYYILSQIGDILQNLYFHYPMPSLRENSLDHVFQYCSKLLTIQLTVDYCTKWIFSEFMLPTLVYKRPLRSIYLNCSGSLGITSKIHPDDFTIAIMESRLPCLKHISVSSNLGWDMRSQDVEDLISVFTDQGGSLYMRY